jgi:Holliday junction resolvasome RuvABC endonuclease subunit
MEKKPQMKQKIVKPKKVKKPKLTKPKTIVKIKSKPVKQIKLNVLLLKLRKLKTIVWGIDMSVAHPGMAKFDTQKKEITFYFIRTRDTEQSANLHIHDIQSVFDDWKFDIFCIEPPSELEIANIGTFPRANRIYTVVKLLTDIINSHGPNQLVAIENYAFEKHSSFRKKDNTFQKSSASSTLLAETGGILRLTLSLAKHQIFEMAITANKKMFTGNGSATKDEMGAALHDIYKFPEFMKLIGLKKEEYVSIPHPCEDLIDAFALALFKFYTM